MKTEQPLNERGLTSWVLGGMVVVTAAALAVVIWFDLAGIQEAEASTSDPAYTADLPPYLGFLSNAGMLVWAAAATVAWWSLATLPVNWARRRFLATGAVVTTVLLMDDLFMMHEWVVPAYTPIPENAVLAALALMAAGFLWVNRRMLPETPWPVLAAGVCGLGVMLGFDLIEHSTDLRWHVVYEEGAKFFGILGWCSYLVLSILPWTRAANRAGQPRTLAEARS